MLFSSIQWNSEWPEMTENDVGLDMPRKSLTFLRVYLLQFDFNVSIDSILLEADCWFQKFKKIVFHIGFSVLIDQMYQKFFLVLIYLQIRPQLWRKQHFWILLSKSQLTVTSFWMFLRWNKFWQCLLDVKVHELSMQKGSINVVSLSVFKLIIF